MTEPAVISHGYYQPYFYWMFPILVAKEQGIFDEVGVRLDVHDIVPGGQPENKASWYEKAIDEGTRDFYFCCAWQGIYSTSASGKGKIGAALKSTLIKTFGLYSKPESNFRNVLDVIESGTPIAVNKNADAHYVTLKNLAEFVPEERITLTHLGGVEKCFQALMAGDVKAATLAGPYAEAADALGYRRLLPLSRTEPTLIVFDDDLGMDAVTRFLNGINRAIVLINADKPKYEARYRREFSDAVTKYMPELASSLPVIIPRISLPVWADARALPKAEFDEIQNFLLEHGLSVVNKGYKESVSAVPMSG